MHQPAPNCQIAENFTSEKLLGSLTTKSPSRAHREVLREQVNLATGNRSARTIYADHDASDISDEVAYMGLNAVAAKGGRERSIHAQFVKPVVTDTRSKKPSNGQADELIEKILALHERISHARCLEPSPEINEMFESLVDIAIKIVPAATTEKAFSPFQLPAIMNDARILAILSSLRALCAESECHLEAHWATAINASKTGGDSESCFNELKAFPYFGNYVDLARMELHALGGISDAPLPTRLAFIGSGPLPLTSLCILHALNRSSNSAVTAATTATILNIDSKPVAIQQSSILVEKIGRWGRGMHFACEAAGAKGRDLSSYDVVFLAALVGATQDEKVTILKGVVGKMRKGALLVVRTARGLRRLLYAKFDYTTESVLSCLEIMAVVHPHNHIVNSIIIGRVR